MHSIDSYVWWEPGCEIELPDISSLRGSDCIMTMQTPCKNTISTAYTAAAHERGRRAVVNNSNYFTLFQVNTAR